MWKKNTEQKDWPMVGFQRCDPNEHRAALLQKLESGEWSALGDAPEPLRSDSTIVLHALSQSWKALQYASEELRGDREIAMKAVSCNWKALQHVSEDLRGDFEVVMGAVSQDGLALEYAAEHLRDNRAVVMAAVSQNWRSLRYASEGLRGDREIVMEALSEDASTFAAKLNQQGRPSAATLQSSDSAQDDIDASMTMRWLPQNWKALLFASEDLWNDRDIVKRAVSHNWQALRYAPAELRGDKEIIACAAFGSPPQALVLKVTLLSGRQCLQIFNLSDNMAFVLQECAHLLDLDPQHVANRGQLVEGTTLVKSLHDLEPGAMNELTLVLC